MPELNKQKELKLQSVFDKACIQGLNDGDTDGESYIANKTPGIPDPYYYHHRTDKFVDFMKKKAGLKRILESLLGYQDDSDLSLSHFIPFIVAGKVELGFTVAQLGEIEGYIHSFQQNITAKDDPVDYNDYDYDDYDPDEEERQRVREEERRRIEEGDYECTADWSPIPCACCGGQDRSYFDY